MEEAEARRIIALIRDLPEDSREVLALLLRNPDGLWFNEIYRRLRKRIGSPTTLSKRLKDLIEMGLIERGRGPQRKSIYRLKPWFFESFHKLFLLGVPKLDPEEEASFLMKLPAIFVGAKEAADRIEELLTGEFIGKEVTKTGQVKVKYHRYRPEEEDVEILGAVLWSLRAIIDAIAHVLILGSEDIEAERRRIMNCVDRLLHTLSKRAGKVDVIKWGNTWCFLSDEWLKYYIALFNWLKPKVESKEYPRPIVIALPERRAITPFGMLWWNIMWLTRNVIHAQAISIAFFKEGKEIFKRFHEEVEKLRRENPELIGTKEGIERLKEVMKRLKKELETETEESSEERE